MIGGEHPTNDWVSTHPAFYKPQNACRKSYTDRVKFKVLKYVDSENKYIVMIGNDVWVGANVLILNGVTIGDGAIIANGAVVTKDVKPYSIVGVIPAKEIRKRFGEEDILFLRDHPFWLQTDAWLEERADQLEDIERYKELFKK